MFLKFESQLRQETDPAMIATLQRKGWTETVQPDHDSESQNCDWINGEWVVSDKPIPPLESAQNYQVRAWMIRGGLSPEMVPTIIAAVVPESVPGGINRTEALMRWDYAVKVPRSFPLVDIIGGQMGLTSAQIDAAWPEILTL